MGAQRAAALRPAAPDASASDAGLGSCTDDQLYAAAVLDGARAAVREELGDSCEGSARAIEALVSLFQFSNILSKSGVLVAAKAARAVLTHEKYPSVLEACRANSVKHDVYCVWRAAICSVDSPSTQDERACPGEMIGVDDDGVPPASRANANAREQLLVRAVRDDMPPFERWMRPDEIPPFQRSRVVEEGRSVFNERLLKQEPPTHSEVHAFQASRPAAVELADYLGNHWKNGALRVQAVTLVGYTSYDVTLEKQDEQKANTIGVPPSKVAFARKNLPGGSKISSAVHCSTYTSPSVST